MLFIAQMPLKLTGIPSFVGSDGFMVLFKCENEPGLCDEWDAEMGANSVLISFSSSPLEVPSSGEVLTPSQSYVMLEECDDSKHDEADGDTYWSALISGKGSVLGRLGGKPMWLQYDETPKCSCGASMNFAFQLEENGGGGINFGGGGRGYAFICSSCQTQARFLFQC
jgi:hypothetical protein